VVREEGLDLDRLSWHLRETGSIAGAPGTEPISNSELLSMPCDVLVPAALDGQITSSNAHSIRARIVAEAANGPTTPDADPILLDRGVLVIPDVLCNAAGVTASYFEWVQNRQAFFWTPDEVKARLRRVLLRALDDVWLTASEHDIGLRAAALRLAVGRVADATRSRGIYS
jgi:glutamate dehydrogenase/leucine dehydrogenase